MLVIYSLLITAPSALTAPSPWCMRALASLQDFFATRSFAAFFFAVVSREKSSYILVWDFGTCCQSGAIQPVVTCWQESAVKDGPVHRNNDSRISQCWAQKHQRVIDLDLRGGAVGSSLWESSVMSWSSLLHFFTIDFWCWLWKGIQAPQRAQSAGRLCGSKRWEEFTCQDRNESGFSSKLKKFRLFKDSLGALSTISVVLTRWPK